jgi:hypothetical protein
MDMLGRGDMKEIMAGLGGQPGQMPQGGLAGLLGGGDQGKQMQPMPGQPGYEQYLANIKQGEIEAEERRKSRLTSGGELERMQAMQEYGYGQKPYDGLAGFMQQQSQLSSQYQNDLNPDPEDSNSNYFNAENYSHNSMIDQAESKALNNLSFTNTLTHFTYSE